MIRFSELYGGNLRQRVAVDFVGQQQTARALRPGNLILHSLQVGHVFRHIYPDYGTPCT